MEQVKSPLAEIRILWIWILFSTDITENIVIMLCQSPMSAMTQLIYVICILCMSSSDLLICRILNFEVRILVIVYFQLLKNSLKLWKRVLLVMFFVWPIRNFLSQLKEKENKYYAIFILQNSKVGKSANHRMTYIWH